MRCKIEDEKNIIEYYKMIVLQDFLLNFCQLIWNIFINNMLLICISIIVTKCENLM